MKILFPFQLRETGPWHQVSQFLENALITELLWQLLWL